MYTLPAYVFFFFFNDTATTEIYTLSLHDALPILAVGVGARSGRARRHPQAAGRRGRPGDVERRTRHPLHPGDRKSTRLNSSHGYTPHADFSFKKRKTDALRIAVESSC